MKATLWLAASLFVLVSCFAACGDSGGHLCPDPSRPCVNVNPDAGADADAD